jgi:hypothetical protein
VFGFIRPGKRHWWSQLITDMTRLFDFLIILIKSFSSRDRSIELNFYYSNYLLCFWFSIRFYELFCGFWVAQKAFAKCFAVCKFDIAVANCRCHRFSVWWMSVKRNELWNCIELMVHLLRSRNLSRAWAHWMGEESNLCIKEASSVLNFVLNSHRVASLPVGVVCACSSVSLLSTVAVGMLTSQVTAHRKPDPLAREPEQLRALGVLGGCGYLLFRVRCNASGLLIVCCLLWSFASQITSTLFGSFCSPLLSGLLLDASTKTCKNHV